MKSKLHLIVILIFSSTLLRAQHIPMVVDSASWTYGDYVDQFPFDNLFFGYGGFQILGDTMINGLTYSKLYESPNFIQLDSGRITNENPCFDRDRAQYVCGLREESNGKVWRLDRGESTEFLAYDFMLAVGDTFLFQKMCNAPEVNIKIPVIGIDTISINGVDRKRIEFLNGIYWFEGIGSSYRIINPCWNLLGNQFSQLDCFSVKGESMYGDSTTCSCKGPGSSIENQLTLLKQVQLFPNPTHAQSTLTFELPQSQFVRFSMSDIQGKLIQEKAGNLGPGQHEILIHKPQVTGIFLVKLQVGKEIYSKKLIVN